MLKCPRCQSQVRDDSRFCALCGTQFSAQTVVKNKTNPLTIIAIVLSVLLSCGICGIIGQLGDKNKTSDVAKTGNAGTVNSGSSTPLPAASLTPSPEAVTPKTLVSTTEKTNSAVVISENANLRETPADEGKVVQLIAEGESVEVIKQKGAWFYVSAGNQKGWIHGNEIRFEKSEQKSSTQSKSIESETELPKSSPSFDSTSPTVTKKQSEPEINSSGATAKCRDGSLSYSRNRRGTCSHHGGVAVWY